MARKRPSPIGTRSLGPISDLERHLPAEWWRSLFNAVYLKTDGDVVENDAATRREIDLLISDVGLQPGDSVLDLCCGQGRHSLELARRGYNRVTGIDRSRYLVRLARKRAKAENLAVQFHEGDARKFRLGEGSFDFILVMGNSFGYFEREEDDDAMLNTIKRALRSNGTLVLDLTDGDWMRENYEPRSWEWVDQDHFVCRERALSTDQQRLISREVVVHADKGVIADQFYAERLYSQDRIVALLTAAAFSNVRIHGSLEADSVRGQDLGMMARRIFLSAAGPTKAAVDKRRIVFPRVTVIMGDPRLPDEVKRGGVYNPEDHDTIRRLKDALSALKGYSFEYLDNHATLAADLRARPPDFVLNLCDEGYNNSALLELHVPALLDMLGVPYTGAGPTCLGLCYNKSFVRSIAMSLDIPVPAETFFDADDQAATIPAILPALIKPATGDSSIGITRNAVVHTATEAVEYIDYLRRVLPGRAVLVQEYLGGAEYSVGLIGNAGLGLSPLPVLEVDYANLDRSLPPILSYESKWEPDSPYWTQIGYREATVGGETMRRLVDHSAVLFERLGCRDYARFDFRCDAAGIPKLLEVNPNPGWCWDGKLNLMAEYAGIGYADLLGQILEAAQSRAAAGLKPAVKTAA